MGWQEKVFWTCIAISMVCKLATLRLKQVESDRKTEEKPVPLNRQQRRHPNGIVPAQRFQRVSVKGRQKQGNGKAVRGW